MAGRKIVDGGAEARVLTAGETGVLQSHLALACSPFGGRGLHPHATARDEQGEHESAERQQGEHEHPDRRGVVVDLQRDEPLDRLGVVRGAGRRLVFEGDRAASVRQLGRLARLQFDRFDTAVVADDRGELLGVEHVHGSRRAVVDAEVALVHAEGEEGCQQVAVRRREGTGFEGDSARVEEGGDAELLRHPVGDLDDPERGERVVLRQERHGVAVDDVAVGVPHRDGRCVSVAEQVDLVAGDVERMVDAHGILTRLAVLTHRDVGREVPRLAGGRRAVLLVGHIERVERHGVRAEGVVADEAPAVHRLVVQQCVDEGLPLDDHALSGVREATADTDRDQHPDERDVKDEVAGLAPITALRGDRVRASGLRGGVVPLDAIPEGLQLFLSDVDRTGCLGLGILRLLGERTSGLAVILQPRQPRRRPRRACTQRLEVMLDARDDAPDEGDEQQQVDRGEPRRQVHVEHVHRVEHGEQIGVVGLPLGHAVGVGHPLREDRAGDRCDGEHEQQDDRRAHRGELTPPPAQPADDSEARLVDRTVVAVDVVCGTERVGRRHGILLVGAGISAGIRAGG